MQKSYRIESASTDLAIGLGRKPYVLTALDVGAVEVNVQAYKGMHQMGRTVQSRQYETRDVTIEGAIFAGSRERMLELKTALDRIASPETDFWMVDDAGWRMRLTAEHTPRYSPKWHTNNSEVAVFAIDATAYAPFWQRAEGATEEPSSVTDMLRFALANEQGKAGIVFGEVKASTTFVMRSESDVPCGMVVEFRAVGGQVAHPTITNVNTGEHFTLGVTLEPGKPATVDTTYGRKSIHLAQQPESDGFSYVTADSTWLQLPTSTSTFALSQHVPKGTEGQWGTLEASVTYTPLAMEV